MSRYSDLKVLVVGDIMLDKYVYCKAKKVSQEAPVIIVKHTEEKFVLGGAGNVATNLKALGASVSIAGVVGTDNIGKILLSTANDLGVATQGVMLDLRPTTVKTRFVVNNHQLLRYDIETEVELDKELTDTMLAYTQFKEFDLIIVVDYDKGVVTKYLMEELVKLGKPIYVNGKPENIDYYVGCTCLVGNDYEIGAIQSYIGSKLNNDLVNYLGCKYLIHTHGNKGLDVFNSASKELVSIPAYKVSEANPVGASDTVIAVVALESQKSDIFKAASLANRAASIIVTKQGTNPINYSELDKYID